ncbi:MAG: hypothetical protein M1822_006577 [Bathelium mastoideum]|nr:MAG: hypothetical protein M1822_006577 [Bathelium mastoideum]
MSGTVSVTVEGQTSSWEQKFALLEQKLTALERRLPTEASEDNKSLSPAKDGERAVLEHNADKKGLDQTVNGTSPDEQSSKKVGAPQKPVSPLLKFEWQKDQGPSERTQGEDDIDAVDETSRVRAIDVRYDDKEGEFVERPAKLQPKSQISQPIGPIPGYAFSWRRKYGRENEYQATTAQIKSNDLRKLIRDTCGVLPTEVQSFSSNTNFRILVWNWDKLEEATKSDAKDDEVLKLARSDLTQLLDHVKTSSEVQPWFERRHSWENDRQITYEYLWTLFPPGELVACEQVIFDRLQAFVVRDYEYTSLERGASKAADFFILTCWTYDFNGETFDLIPGKIKIEKFEGAKAINALRVFPIKYHRDGTKVNAELKKRGKKFCEYCTAPKGRQLFYCNGPVLGRQAAFVDTLSGNTNQYDAVSTVGSDVGEYSGGPWFKTQGNVIVDHKSYLEYNDNYCGPMGRFERNDPNDECSCPACLKTIPDTLDFRNNKFTESEEFTDLQYIICPARFLGYIMASKTWVSMSIDAVHPLRDRVKEDAFERLILGQDEKDLVRSLVGNHEKKKALTDDKGNPIGEDFIEGKGRGLVILLHGPPGVGKTSTAESVALATGKPLFSVSVSDIGMKPEDVQGKLNRIFNLAARWEAVLLFDEADVFLESRGMDKGDLTRNSLVTVFLRILEYYDGILILTTNRIKSFDVAVQSRVHLAIRYEELRKDNLQKLFLRFLEEIKEEVHGYKAIERWIKDDFEGDMDGRQISKEKYLWFEYLGN